MSEMNYDSVELDMKSDLSSEPQKIMEGMGLKHNYLTSKIQDQKEPRQKALLKNEDDTGNKLNVQAKKNDFDTFELEED